MAKYCRICTNKITDDDYKSQDECNLPQLLKLYLPELITKVSESVVCLRCFSVLQLFNTLRGKAVRTETKVQSYATANPTSIVFTMAEALGKTEEKEAEKEVVVKMDNSDEIIVTIDDSSGDEDDEEMIVEDVIVKEDNDLDVLIKSEAEDDSDSKDL